MIDTLSSTYTIFTKLVFFQILTAQKLDIKENTVIRIKIISIIFPPLKVIVACIKIIKLCVLVVIVTTISDGITGCNTVCIKGDRTITPSVVPIFYHNITRIVKHADDICTVKKRVPPKRHSRSI